jgi:hypothetical protein
MLTSGCVNGCKAKENTWPAVLEMTSIFRVFRARNLNCVLRASDFQWHYIIGAGSNEANEVNLLKLPVNGKHFQIRKGKIIILSVHL